MAKAVVTATYVATVDIGNLPLIAVEEAVRHGEESGDFGFFDLPGAKLEEVNAERGPSK